MLSFFTEKLQAIASPWAEYVNELDMKYVSISGGLASHVEFDMKRGRTFQNLASMLYCCEEVDLRRSPSALQLERWLNEPKGPSPTFKFRVERMLSNLLDIACDTALNRGFTGFSAKVSPAEFVFIGMWSFPRPLGSLSCGLCAGVLLYVMHEDDVDFRDRERAAAILHLRYELRQTHKDVRLNTRVCKHSWAIIDAVNERKVNLSLTSMIQRVAPKGPAPGKNAKRKKRAQTDDDSGNENIQSPSRSVAAKKTKVTHML